MVHLRLVAAKSIWTSPLKSAASARLKTKTAESCNIGGFDRRSADLSPADLQVIVSGIGAPFHRDCATLSRECAVFGGRLLTLGPHSQEQSMAWFHDYRGPQHMHVGASVIPVW
jgi:hypothetical protein